MKTFMFLLLMIAIVYEAGVNALDKSEWPSCSEEFHQCPNTGKCITKDHLCDGFNDCHDYSDETGCASRTCSLHDQYGETFRCNDGVTCLSHHYYLCDGNNDCPGGEDEATDKCDAKGCYEGITSYVKCTYFGGCYLLSEICNGENICRMGSYRYRPNPGVDTTDCAAFSCPEGYFKCKTGKCIPKSQICDGQYDDCGDASDEADCNFSCEGRCHKSNLKYWCGCSVACEIDNSCCHDYKDVCPAPARCTDLVDFDEKSMVQVILPQSEVHWSKSRVNLILRDSFNASDSSVYTVHYNYNCDPSIPDGCDSYSCTSLVMYPSYDDLKIDNSTAELDLKFICIHNTIRIYNRILYCQVTRQNYGSSISTYIYKVNMSNGNIIKSRKLPVESLTCTEVNYYSKHMPIEYMLDSTGFWLFYKHWDTSEYVLEMIDPDDLGTIYTVQGSQIKSNEFTTKNPVQMICGKIYHFSFTSNSIRVTRAVDIFNSANVYDGPTVVAKIDMSDMRHLFLHYNPATNEVHAHAFKYMSYETKTFIFSPQRCNHPFVNIASLSNISSTFHWSLVQTETRILSEIVNYLINYFKLTDPVLLSNITNTVLTCPDANCNDRNQSSIHCITQQLISDLKIYSDHKQLTLSPAITLQTKFKMRELLQQQFNRQLSTQINDLRFFISQSFEELESSVISLQNELQQRLSNYYSTLAEYDRKKSDADIQFIYGRLEKYKKSIDDISGVLGPKLGDLFVATVTSVSTDIFGHLKRVAVAAVNAANPIEKIFNGFDSILTLWDAIAALMGATVRLNRSIYVVDKVIPRIKKEADTLNAQMWKNMETQSNIINMVKGGFEKQLYATDTVKYMNGFLKEYSDYTPILTAGMFAKYESMLNGAIEELCELLFAGETVESGIAQHVFASKGICLEIKFDVEELVATYLEMYDFQFELMEALASFVRASVAEAAAKQIAETIDGGLTAASKERNELALKAHTLRMCMVDNVHMGMVVYDACNLIKYKNGGQVPDYCERLLIDSHTTEFDKLVAYPYDTDMCARDNIKKYVNIPARIKENSEDSLPSYMINLGDLYSGKEVRFQVPDSSWLVKYNWLNAIDVTEPVFIKQFQLFLPPLNLNPHRTADIHVIVDMEGDNYITKDAEVYTFSSPVQYNFRYTPGYESCFHGEPLDGKRNPYNVQGCPDRQETPCVTSEGLISGTPFHPSVFARWKLRTVITGNLTQPSPAGEIYLRAGMTFCKVGVTRSARSVALRNVNSPVCCNDRNQFHNVSSPNQPCQSCPNASCPKLQGYYCEKDCTVV